MWFGICGRFGLNRVGFAQMSFCALVGEGWLVRSKARWGRVFIIHQDTYDNG